jgi:hypothetical protein
VTTPPSVREGRRLIGELDELETATVVAGARPREGHGRVPRMQEMVTAVYDDYERAVAGSGARRSVGGGADSFADLRDRARVWRPASATRRAGVPGGAAVVPQPRQIEPDVVERIVRYAGDLHEIVGEAAPRRPALRRYRAGGGTPPADDAPVVRAGRLEPPEARKIRLAHELGVKPLTAWTVVRISGDMATAFSRRGESALVGFHGALSADSLCYWRGLIANVAQVLSTLLGFVLAFFHLRTRPGLHSAAALWARLERTRTVSLRWVVHETWELMGQGGKVFETGTGAALRSLLQPDGTIVTHARPAALADEALTQRHTALIDDWLRRLLEQWRAVNDALQVLAAVALIAFAVWEFARYGWDDVLHALMRSAIAAAFALLLRGATAWGIRRAVFRAR